MKIFNVIAGAALTIAALQLGVAHAETKIEDAVTGAVVSDSIKLHGFMHSAPLPLPPGQWEITDRQDYEESFPGNRKLPFVQLSFINKNPEAQMRFFMVSFNPETDKVGYGVEECKNPKALVANDFGTLKTQFMRRCGLAFKTYDFFNAAQKANDSQEKSGSVLKGYRGLIGHNEVLSKEMVDVYLHAFLDGGRLTFWEFLMSVPSAQFADTEKLKQAAAGFVQGAGDQLGNFLNGDKAVLPSELKFTP